MYLNLIRADKKDDIDDITNKQNLDEKENIVKTSKE